MASASGFICFSMGLRLVYASAARDMHRAMNSSSSVPLWGDEAGGSVAASTAGHGDSRQCSMFLLRTSTWQSTCSLTQESGLAAIAIRVTRESRNWWFHQKTVWHKSRGQQSCFFLFLNSQPFFILLCLPSL